MLSNGTMNLTVKTNFNGSIRNTSNVWIWLHTHHPDLAFEHQVRITIFDRVLQSTASPVLATRLIFDRPSLCDSRGHFWCPNLAELRVTSPLSKPNIHIMLVSNIPITGDRNTLSNFGCIWGLTRVGGSGIRHSDVWLSGKYCGCNK